MKLDISIAKQASGGIYNFVEVDAVVKRYIRDVSVPACAAWLRYTCNHTSKGFRLLKQQVSDCVASYLIT